MVRLHRAQRMPGFAVEDRVQADRGSVTIASVASATALRRGTRRRRQTVVAALVHRRARSGWRCTRSDRRCRSGSAQRDEDGRRVLKRRRSGAPSRHSERFSAAACGDGGPAGVSVAEMLANDRRRPGRHRFRLGGAARPGALVLVSRPPGRRAGRRLLHVDAREIADDGAPLAHGTSRVADETPISCLAPPMAHRSSTRDGTRATTRLCWASRSFETPFETPALRAGSSG